MSELVQHQSTEIDKDAVLRHLKLNPREAATQALLLTCERYNLDPLLKHAVLIEGRLYVTRDGLLHVAHSSKQLDGIEVMEQFETATHHVARVTVYRKDMSHPFTYVGRFPKMRKVWQGSGNHRKQVEELHPYGPEMAVKCAEVMCLRRAFDVSLAAAEEMWDEPVVQQAPEPLAPPQPAQIEPVKPQPAPAQESQPEPEVVEERSPQGAEQPKIPANEMALIIPLRKAIKELDPQQKRTKFEELQGMSLQQLEQVKRELMAERVPAQ